MNRSALLRSTGVVALATLLVRLAGLGREMASAWFFGTTPVYDAFLLAFMIPNFFRGILGEGGLNSAFIPVFADYLDPGRQQEARRLVRACAGALLCLTIALGLLFLVGASLAGRLPLSEKTLLALSFLRATIFYLAFVSLAALAMGVLNSLGHFSAPALAPLGLDACWVAGLVLLGPLLGPTLIDRAWGLVIGALAGGGAQIAFSLPALRRRGFSLRPSFEPRHPALARMGRLLLPVLIGMAVGPLNLLCDYLLANLLAPGMVSALWFANRLMQLPLGVFGLALGSVALPGLARLAAAGRDEEMSAMVAFALRLCLLLVVPAAAALAVFRGPIIAVLFERGLFDTHSTAATGRALLFYAPGIPAYAAAAVLSRTFYARRDTATPVRVGVLSIAVNLLLNLALMGPLQQAGIALSTSLVGFANCFLLFHLLRRRLGPLGGRQTAREGLFCLAWTAAAILAALATARLVSGFAGTLPALLVSLAAGGALYSAGALSRLRAWRRRERPRPPAGDQ